MIFFFLPIAVDLPENYIFFRIFSRTEKMFLAKMLEQRTEIEEIKLM